MALKDWKKVGKTRWQKKNYEIAINNYIGYWLLFIFEYRFYRSSHDIIEKREFKTKSQALKFAKEYMRK